MGCDIHFWVEARPLPSMAFKPFDGRGQSTGYACDSCTFDADPSTCRACRGTKVNRGGGTLMDREWYTDRCYPVFSVLAGVRQGYAEDGDTVWPMISPPRGLPEDHTAGDEWLGDHSFTWLMLDEVLDYPWEANKVERSGHFLSRMKYLSEVAASKGFSPDNVRLVFGFDN